MGQHIPSQFLPFFHVSGHVLGYAGLNPSYSLPL